MRVTTLGLGYSAVSVITSLHNLLGDSHALLSGSRCARQATLTINSAAIELSYHLGGESLVPADESTYFVLIIVDPDDAGAVRGAVEIGMSSRSAGSYLVVALCSEPIMEVHFDPDASSSALHALRAAVDSLVMVKTTLRPSNGYEHVTRIAYTLVAATLGHRVNLIDLDLSDLKEALRGLVVAAVTRTDLSDTRTTGDIAGFDGRIHLTPSLAGNPRGLFCSYGASLDRLRLEDFESVGSVIQEELRRVYPMHDVTIAVACLADNSLDQASEVVTCLAFDG